MKINVVLSLTKDIDTPSLKASSSLVIYLQCEINDAITLK